MKLVITNKNTAPNVKRSYFKLVVNNMHGDEDVNTKNTAYFKSEFDVVGALKLLREIDECFEAGEYDLADELIGELPEDLIEYDSTNPEAYCHPTLHKLTWIDEDGDECGVRIQD